MCENFGYKVCIISQPDINKNEEFYVETLFGAGDIVYANENNLYLTRQVYGEEYKTIIYKFMLDGAKIKLYRGVGFGTFATNPKIFPQIFKEIP